MQKIELTGLSRNQILNELVKSPHGKLNEYTAVGRVAAVQHAEFLAHLIAWNQIKGQIRDSKTALPVVSLTVPSFSDREFVGNSLAHLAMLDPRSFVKAFRFAKELSANKSVGMAGRMMMLRRLGERYLHFREQNWQRFERSNVLHRRSLREMYALFHVKPSMLADNSIMKGHNHVRGSRFEAVANLGGMSAAEAASMILDKKLPFLVVSGALGAKIKDPDVALALISRMSPTELVTNQKMLQAMGVKTIPAVRAAYEAALAKAATSKKNTLKATKAIESIEDEGMKAKLKDLQEKQIKQVGIDGNWLVLGDKSGSMAKSIELARVVAGTLSKLVQGNVYLIFFDTHPVFYDVTGKSYDEILAATKHVNAGGGTSIGCGLRYAIDAKLDIDGIALVSDGGENTAPKFADQYKRYEKMHDQQPPVYFYHVNGDSSDGLTGSCKAEGIEIQEFSLTGQVDYYSIPNLAQTMRVSRYSIYDEILGTPLVKLSEVFEGEATSLEEEVYANTTT